MSSVGSAKTISYGNGLYCKKNGRCWVDKGEMWNGVAHIISRGWMENGPWMHPGK